jgi:hypothetical protein
MIEIYVSKKDASSRERANILAERFNVKIHVLKCRNEEFPFYLTEALAYAPAIAVHYLSRGVAIIPSVVYDGKCIFCGYVPSPDELRDALIKYTPWEQLLKNVDYEEISLEKAREAYLAVTAQKRDKTPVKTHEKKSSRRKKKTAEEKAEKTETVQAVETESSEEKQVEGKGDAEKRGEATALGKGSVVDSLVVFVPDAVKE